MGLQVEGLTSAWLNHEGEVIPREEKTASQDGMSGCNTSPSVVGGLVSS